MSGAESNGSPQVRVIPLTCPGHTRPVNQLQFSQIQKSKNGSSGPQEIFVISSCKDGQAMIRDGVTGDWIGTFFGHKGAVWNAKLSKDSTLALTGSADFTSIVWSAIDGLPLLILLHPHIVRSVDFEVGGAQGWTRVVTGGHDSTIRIWAIPEHIRARTTAPSPASEDDSAVTTEQHDTPLAVIKGAHLKGAVRSIMWIPHEESRSIIISAGEDGHVKWWSPETTECLKDLDLGSSIASMELSIDGQLICISCAKQVTFVSAKTWELLKSISLDYKPSSVASMPIKDSETQPSRFATGSSDDTWVRVHDFATGQQLEMYKGHHGPVHSVAYSPDGCIYATASEDGTIRYWQTFPGTAYGLWQRASERST